VFAVEIEGVRHEFTAIPGVEEDVTAIVLNLKDFVLRLMTRATTSKRSKPRFKGPGVLKAGDLKLPAFVSVVNPDLEIAHLNKDGHLKMTIYAATGRGYFTSEANKIERKINTIGVICDRFEL
jgi:DNA-directed RNA polymerase subunit alpha